MFDTENRDDPKRERSLLALGGGAVGEPAAKASSSLLSIPEDATTRHRQARSRREARLVETHQTPVDKDKRPADAPAQGQTSTDRAAWIAGLMPLWRARQARAQDKPKPAVEAQAPVAAASQAEPSSEFSEEATPAPTRDGDGWQPLIDPMKVIGGVYRSRWLIFSTTVIGALLGITIAVMTPKKYEASVELLVDPRDLNLVERDLTQNGLSNEATLAVVENQVRVLTSGTVLTQVVDKLNLASDPEFNGKGGAGGLSGIVSDLRSILSRSDSGGDDGKLHTLAVRHLGESLSVERGGKTFVIVISATTLDGDKSALIANTMTEVFLKTYGKIQSDTAGRAAEELNSRLDQLRAGVEAAERKVETFKAENDIIDAQGRLISDDEIVKLNEQLAIARARTLELNAKASSTRTVDVDAVLGGVLPEELASATITELRSQYAALKSEGDRLAVQLGPRHPQRLAVEAQLAGARDQLAAELRRLSSSAQTELKRAVQLEQELASRLAQLKVRQGSLSGELVTLRELEREATAKRAVYEAFLLRARETGEQKDINAANMSVISKAFPPLEANPPSRSTIALSGLLLGLFAGILFGAMRGAYDSLRGTANRQRNSKLWSRRKQVRETVADKPVPTADQKTPAPLHETGSASADAGPEPVKPDHSIPPAAPAAQSKDSSMQDTVYPGYPPYAPQPQAYSQAGQTSLYPQQAHPGPYPQQPVYQPQPVPPVYGVPYAPQGHYAQPMGYPPAGAQHWQQQMTPPAYPYPQPGYPQAMFHPAQMQPQGYPQATAPQQAQADTRQRPAEEGPTPVEEIRASLREFRDAVRELTESRTRRRYF